MTRSGSPKGNGSARRNRAGRRSCPRPRKASGKLLEAHPVGSLGDRNLGVFTVADIALEIADTVPLTHFIAGVPNPAYEDLGRCCPPAAALAGLERSTRRQSCSTRHSALLTSLEPGGLPSAAQPLRELW